MFTVRMNAKFKDYQSCVLLGKIVREKDPDAGVQIREGKGGDFWFVEVIFDMEPPTGEYIRSMKERIEQMGGHCGVPGGRAF